MEKAVGIAVCASTYGTTPDVAVLLEDGTVCLFVQEAWKRLPPIPEPEPTVEPETEKEEEE